MEVALVGDQLRGGDMLQLDVVSGIAEDGVAGAVVVGGRKQRRNVGKDALAKLNCNVPDAGGKPGQGDEAPTEPLRS